MSSEQYPQASLNEATESYRPRRECQVAEAAHARLRDWGIDDVRIQQLAEIAAMYDYADCEGVLHRILQQPATTTYVADSEAAHDREAVVIDPIRDYEDAQSGQCSEIAFKVGRELYGQGWLAAVNEQNGARGLPMLNLYRCEGQTKDFFSNEGAQHIWLSLAPEGAEDQIIIDGSFLHIIPQPEDDYIEAVSWPLQHSYQAAVDRAFALGDYYMAEDRKRINPARSQVLGLSVDRQMCVTLGFVADQVQGGGILPVIHLYDRGGVCVVSAFEANDEPLWYAAQESIKEKYKNEVLCLLTIARSFCYKEGGVAGVLYEPRMQQLSASLGRLSVAHKS